MDLIRNSSSSTFGLFFDSSGNNDIQLRVLDPDVGQVTGQLIQQCQEFIQKSEKFEQVLQQFVDIVGKVASDVEIARMKALGSKNLNWSARKEGMIALILEKRKELERIRVHRESLERQESDQNDLIASLNARVKVSYA